MQQPDTFSKQNATAAGAAVLFPGPHLGSLQHSPDDLAGFKGAASRRAACTGARREGKREVGTGPPVG